MSETTGLDHAAIRKAYPNVTFIDDDGSVIKDASGNTVAVEQSKIDEARVVLDAEFTANKYQKQRAEEYPDWGVQLDYIYHNGIEKWKTDIVDPVKAKYPKPS